MAGPHLHFGSDVQGELKGAKVERGRLVQGSLQEHCE